MAPSLPGYGFSSAPKHKGFALMSIAKTFNQLMLELGYTKYVAQGDKRFEHVCYVCLRLMHIQALFGLAGLVFTSNVLCVSCHAAIFMSLSVRQTCQAPRLQVGIHVLCAIIVHQTACSLAFACPQADNPYICSRRKQCALPVRLACVFSGMHHCTYAGQCCCMPK